MTRIYDLKRQLSDDQRALLTAIWDHYLEKGEWILRRHLHVLFQHLGKPGIQAAFRSPLGGTVVFESMDSGREIYRLTILGVLLSNQGDGMRRLLGQYLGHVRKEFQGNLEITKIESKDVEAALSLSSQELRALWELLSLGSAWTGSPGGNREAWSASLPRDVEDLLVVRDLEAHIHERVMEDYDPEIPIDEAGRMRMFPWRQGKRAGHNAEIPLESLQEEGADAIEVAQRSTGNRLRFDLTELWGPLRVAIAKHLSFSAIKDVVALAGLDMASLAHLTQHGQRWAAKGALMDAIDGLYGQLTAEHKELFIRVAAEEGVRRSPKMGEDLDTGLRRLGWQFLEGRLLPVEVLDRIDVEAVPEVARHDLAKAAARFRDGDLTGALSAACSAVDSACADVYRSKLLGAAAKAESFQEKVSRSLGAHGSLAVLENSLRELGWVPEEAMRLRQNLQQSLNQAAYVMQSLRSRMGDAHGSKPVLEAVVFDSIRWATIITSFLK